ncbi:uncharacterized protein METZ01_LOCUS317816 [marine metagenome]|uniref:Uncharacterized protein n=1 Tax=marine metagenome TaxID=408172 RepID=A0A382NZ24_9ZZZZ
MPPPADLVCAFGRDSVCLVGVVVKRVLRG